MSPGVRRPLRGGVWRARRSGRRRCSPGRSAAAGGERSPNIPTICLFGEAQAAVGAEPVEQVVRRQALAQVQRGGDGVLLDDLDARFPRPTPFLTAAISTLVVVRNGRYRSSSRLTTAGYTPNSSSTVNIVSNSPSNAKNASGNATRRTTEHNTSPSFHWSPPAHRPLRRTAQDHREPVDPLAGTGVHLVRHRREPTWPSLKPSVTSSFPAISRIVVATYGRQPAAPAPDHLVVERPRVDLPDAGELRLNPRWRGDVFSSSPAFRVAAEQVEHVLRGAHRALDAAQRVPLDQLLDRAFAPAIRPRRKRTACRAWSPARRRCANARQHQRRVVGGLLAEPYSGCDRTSRTSSRPAGSATARRSRSGRGSSCPCGCVRPGERAELLDPGLHVVPGHPLAGGDRFQINLIHHRS